MNNNEDSKKEIQSNQEIHKKKKKKKKNTIVRDPQINKKYFISFFLNYGYNVLTKTWYKVQISSKIIDFDGYLSL